MPARANIIRDLMGEWATERGMPRDLTEDVKLAAYEAMANVCEHAYPADLGGTMRITTEAQPHSVVVTVTDSGRWVDRDSRPHGGRGIAIMRALAPEASVTSMPTGTVVRLAWPWPPPPSRP